MSLHNGFVQPIQLVKLLLAVLLLAWSASSVFQFYIFWTASTQTAHLPATENLIENRESSRSSLPDVDISALKALRLFGDVAAVAETAVEEVQKEQPLVETKLNLTLKGLFTSADDDSGYAIIANGRDEQLYKTGEDIEGLENVSLTDVLSDQVKLNNRGNAEVLYLYPPGERISASSVGGGATGARLEDDPVPSIDPPLPSTANNNVKLNQIMRVVRERDKATGAMLGFRVLPGRDREAFERSGLQLNDVITSIDGEPLTDLRTATNIYRNKRDASEITLVVRRGDEDISLDIDLNNTSL